MADAALRPVLLDEGTSYPVEQSLLDKALNFSTGPHAPFVHPVEAIKEHNRTSRRYVNHPAFWPSWDVKFEETKANIKSGYSPTVTEDRAIDRLTTALEEVDLPSGWTPALIIKMFPDIDTVFFGGALLGKVLIRWQAADYDNNYNRRSEGADRAPTCWLENPGKGSSDIADGQCRIWMNAAEIFRQLEDPFKLTWRLLLHNLVLSLTPSPKRTKFLTHSRDSMKDAYLIIRPKQEYLNDPFAQNDKYHRTALNSIHKRSMRLFDREVLQSRQLELMTNREEGDRGKCYDGACEQVSCAEAGRHLWREIYA